MACSVWFISIYCSRIDTCSWLQLHTSHPRLKFRTKGLIPLSKKGLTRESSRFCVCLFSSLRKWWSLLTGKVHIRFKTFCKYIIPWSLAEFLSILWMPQLGWWYIFPKTFYIFCFYFCFCLEMDASITLHQHDPESPCSILFFLNNFQPNRVRFLSSNFRSIDFNIQEELKHLLLSLFFFFVFLAKVCIGTKIFIISISKSFYFFSFILFLGINSKK